MGVKGKCEEGSQGGVKTGLLGVECRSRLLRASGKQTKGEHAGSQEAIQHLGTWKEGVIRNSSGPRISEASVM